MSYVPPHLRNRKHKEKEKFVEVEAEFPAMAETRQVNFKGESFASKVAIKSDEEALVGEVEREYRPMFLGIRKKTQEIEEEEYSQDDYEDEEKPGDEDDDKAPEDDGWKVVERKVRVKRDKVQEALDNGDAPIEDENEDSAWNEQPEEYETYWGERY